MEKFVVGYVDEESQWIQKFQFNLSDYFDIKVFQLNETITLDNLTNNLLSSELDCIVVDYELTETATVSFNGDDVIESVRKTLPYFPVFIITSKDEEYVLSNVEDNEIVRMKDELTSKAAVLAKRIENKIINYKQTISNSKRLVEEYSELKHRGEILTSEQEEDLFQNYMFLEKAFPEEKIFPDTLIEPSSAFAINSFVNETKEILEELKKMNQ